MGKRKRQPAIAFVNEDYDLIEEEYSIQIAEQLIDQFILSPSLLLTGTRYKPLRQKLYSLMRAMSLSADFHGNVNMQTSQQLSDLINSQLQGKRWCEAVVSLSAMIDLQRRPKLGSIQRWVASICDHQAKIWGTEMGTKLLGLVMQCSQSQLDRYEIVADEKIGKSRLPSVCPAKSDEVQNDVQTPVLKFNEVADKNDVGNHQKIWQVDQSLLEMLTADNDVEAHPFWVVPKSVMMTGVLSSTTCKHLIQVAEQVGFQTESGYSFQQDKGAGAAGVVLLMDELSCQWIFERILPHLPDITAKPYGINARFRLYKYQHGAVYKPHIDGAWPRSGIDANGQYQFDVSQGTQMSRMTCILYLNDDFEGGKTMFYRAADSGNGDMQVVAQGVQPTRGMCLVFPHGEAASPGGIVHEGTAVTQGTKYIIRTDILFERSSTISR